ncbi:MAG: hypothetical protein PVH04_09710, partial [Gammaproteobacteria bacterium]
MKTKIIELFIFAGILCTLIACNGGSDDDSTSQQFDSNTGTLDVTVDGWHWANPYPQGNDIHSIAWSETLQIFAAVGEHGAIVTSSNGTSWQHQDSLNYNKLFSIVWANNLFVAVGANGTIITSSDGTNWTLLSVQGFDSTLESVIWTGTQFYASGAFYVVVSSDGVNWTPIEIECRLDSNEPCTRNSVHLDHVLWTGVQYVAMDNSRIYTSTDGTVWTHRYNLPGGSIKDISWSGDIFVVAGGGTVLTSDNGIDWSEQPLSGVWTNVIWTGIEFVIVSNNGILKSSADGQQWNYVTQLDTGLLTIVKNNTTYVAGGFRGAIYSSTDLQTWNTDYKLTETRINDIAWVDNQFIAIGNAGTILSSIDGENWQSQTSGVAQDLNAIAYSGSGVVVIGDEGTILSSSDGTTWEPQTTDFPNDLMGIVWVQNRFTVVGMGIVLSSIDGTNWNTHPLESFY